MAGDGLCSSSLRGFTHSSRGCRGRLAFSHSFHHGGKHSPETSKWISFIPLGQDCDTCSHLNPSLAERVNQPRGSHYSPFTPWDAAAGPPAFITLLLRFWINPGARWAGRRQVIYRCRGDEQRCVCGRSSGFCFEMLCPERCVTTCSGDGSCSSATCTLTNSLLRCGERRKRGRKAGRKQHSSGPPLLLTLERICTAHSWTIS